jgi:hypothetical protein
MEVAYNAIQGVRAGSFSMKLRTRRNAAELLAKKGTPEYAGETHVTIQPPEPPPPPASVTPPAAAVQPAQSEPAAVEAAPDESESEET